MPPATKSDPPRAYTVKQLSESSGWGVSTILKLIEEGQLPALSLPGRKPGDGRRGPKGIRILLEEWNRFLRANTKVAGPKAEEKPAKPLPSGRTGTDGVDRMRRTKA